MRSASGIGKLKFSRTAKYGGIWYDDDLSFGEHAKETKENEKRSLETVLRLMKKYKETSEDMCSESDLCVQDGVGTGDVGRS